MSKSQRKIERREFLRRAARGAAGFALGGGCVKRGLNEGSQGTAQRPYLAEMEAMSVGEAGEVVSRLELYEGGKKLLRVEHTEGDNPRNRIGARVNIDSSCFRGYVDVFGTNDSKDSSGEGVNWDGHTGRNGRVIFGGAAEKAMSGGVEGRVVNVYTGVDFRESNVVTFAIGGAELRRGLDRRGVGHGNLLIKRGNFISGLGTVVDDSEGRYAHFVAGQLPEIKGHDFGWRFYAFSEFGGDVTLNFLGAWKAAFGNPFFLDTFARHQTPHEGKLRAVSNVMDYVIPDTPLFKRTQGSVAVAVAFNRSEGENNVVAETAFFPAGLMGRLGGRPVLDNLWIGVGHDTSTGKWTGKVGTKAWDKLVLIGTFPDGKKPIAFAGLYHKF